MAPRLRPLLTLPNDGRPKENRLDLRVALKKGAGHRYEILAGFVKRALCNGKTSAFQANDHVFHVVPCRSISLFSLT